MKAILVLALSIAICSCKTEIKVETTADIPELNNEINKALDAWHMAAAEANYENYFNSMTKDAVFIGTDATENWGLDAFKSFSKPYFDKGKAWSFTAVERNIYMHDDNKLAWFDELLDTQMKLCRGSGIMKLVDKEWKVQHYVLSLAVPNDNVKEVVALKKTSDSLYVINLKTK